MSDDDEIEIRITRPEQLSALDQLVFAKWAEFVTRLSTRQGTRPIDFDALQRRKAEIDRRMLRFGGTRPEQPPE